MTGALGLFLPLADVSGATNPEGIQSPEPRSQAVPTGAVRKYPRRPATDH
jgi:hypothetical protein